MDEYGFEIRQIDAWHDDEGWTYNESWHIDSFRSCAANEKRLFLRKLRKHGITFKRGAVRVEYSGDIWEIVNRKTLEPLFCMIPSA